MSWALLSFLFILPAIAATTPTTVEVTADTILVKARIEFIRDDSRLRDQDLKTKIQVWDKVLNTGWNRPSHRFQQRKVRFEFTLRTGKDMASSTAHHIRVVFGLPTIEGTYAAYVQRSENPMGPHIGAFPIQISDRTLLHEAGHLLNLDDEYVGVRTDEPLDSILLINGVTLVPAEFGRPVQNYRNVSYGPSPGQSGVMGHHSDRIRNYYIGRILISLLGEAKFPE
jgi:hypothetical protein